MPINKELLRPEDVGRFVKYAPFGNKLEYGRIKSWNDTWVFVVYGIAAMAPDWRNYTAAATEAGHLDWVWPTEHDRAKTGAKR